MKISHQERYDEMIAHAKETDDNSLQNCLDRLKRWETNSNGRSEIELLLGSCTILHGIPTSTFRWYN